MRFFRDISIGIKVLIPPFIFVIALVSLAAWSFLALGGQQGAINTVHDAILGKTALINEFIVLSEQVLSDIFRLSLARFVDLPSHDALLISERIDLRLNDLDITYGEIEELGQLDEEEQALLGLAEEPLGAFVRQARQAADVVADDPASGLQLVPSAAESFGEFRRTLDRFLEIQNEKASQLHLDSERQALAASRAILGVVILTGISGLLAAALISSRLISRPIIAMTQSMRLLAGGNRSIEVPCADRGDEIGSMARAVEVFRNQAIEKAQVEDALRRERDGAQKYLDIAGVMLVGLDEEGTIRLINRKGCSILGYREDELIGKNWGAMCLPEHVRPRVRSEFLKLMEGSLDEFSEHANPILTKAGEERLIAWRTTLLTDEGGRRIGTLSSGEDVTEQKRAEIALQESEQRYRILFEQAPDGMLLYSPDDDKIVDFNTRVHENLGYTRDEFAKLAIHEIDARQTAGDVARHAAKTIEEDGATFETKHITKDGHIRNMIVSSRPISIGGRILLQGIWKDTTELRETESALRESEERYRALFEASPVAVLVHAEGHIVFANPEAIRILKAKSSSELIGKPAMAFVHDDSRPIAEERIHSVYDKRGSVGPHEERLVRCDGSFFEAQVTRAMVDFMGRPASQTLIQDITESKKARLELQRLKDFNESIVQTMAEGVVIEDENGIITFVNPAAGELLGYLPEELEGQHYSIIVPQNQRPFVEEVNQRRRDGVSSQYELKVITKEGELREALVSGIPRFEDGSFGGTLAVFTDITELKQAESARRESEERLQSVVANVPVILFAFNGQGTISVTDGKGLEALGMKPGDAVGESIFDEKHRLQQPEENIRRVLGGESFEALVDSNGVVFDTRYTPLRNEKGKIVGATCVATDISARVQAEQKMREREQRFRSVAETAAEAIVLAGSDGRIGYWNKAAESIFGYKAAEVEGKPIAMLMPEDLADLHEASMDHLIQTGTGRLIGKTAELTGRRKDGSVFPLELSLAYWRSGDELSFSAIIRDVTEARKAQEREQLQNRLAAVGQMAAGIAHDFNNILATIILNCEVLIQTPSLSTGVRRRLMSVLQQAERAAALTSQILDFSRKSIMARHELDLVPFLEEMQSLLARILPENITVGLINQEHRCLVKADPTRMQQIFLNLALNARDAMPEGGELKLELSQVRVEAPESAPIKEMASGNWARICVSDTGTGIAQEHMAHLFEPFFTTKPPGEGTGLGLAQVYGIARQHEGHIEVVSQMGEGTTFMIYLPVLEGQPERDEKTDEVDMHVDMGQGETILVVEDDEATRLAVADILETLNYRTLLAEDGGKALNMLQQHAKKTAAVLTDLVMPGVGGVELYRKVREMLPTLPVVVMTGYPLGEDTRDFLEEQQVMWMQKPFSSEILAATLREAIACNS